MLAIFDDAGTIVERYEYDPYGRTEIYTGAGDDTDWFTSDDVLDEGSAIGNPYMWTGRRLDEESDLYYFRARMWNTAMGRFINRDPIGYADGMNLYAGYFVPGGVDPWGLAKVYLWTPTKKTYGHASLNVDKEHHVSLLPKEGESKIKQAYGAELDQRSHTSVKEDKSYENSKDPDKEIPLSPGFSDSAMRIEINKIKQEKKKYSAIEYNCVDAVIRVLKAGATQNVGLDCSNYCCPKDWTAVKIDLFARSKLYIGTPTKENWNKGARFDLETLVEDLNKNKGRRYKCVCLLYW